MFSILLRIVLRRMEWADNSSVKSVPLGKVTVNQSNWLISAKLACYKSGASWRKPFLAVSP